MIKIFLSAFVLVFFCTNADSAFDEFPPGECSAGNAPFIVGQVTRSPNDEAITIAHGADGLAKTFTLNVKACLRELIRQDNPIQNAPFVVEYYSSSEDKRKGIKQKVPVTSDTQGCIQWQEKYQYKYTVRPLWIGLERTVKKESGTYAGAETIPMAVNPWLSSGDKKNGLPPILDTRCKYSREHHIFDKEENYDPKGLGYLAEMKRKERPLLWAPEVSLQVREINPNLQQTSDDDPQGIKQLLKNYQRICGENTEEGQSCYKRKIEMVLYIPLQFRALDMISSAETDLNGGTYDIETQLVISPDEDEKNYLLHDGVCNKRIELNQTSYKTLSLSCALNLSYFSQDALYKLALRIKPFSEELPFKTFEGVYTINLNFQNERKDFPIDSIYDEDYAKVLNAEEELEIIENLNIVKIRDADFGDEHQESEEDQQLPYVDEGPIQGVNLYSLHLDGYGEYKLSHIKSGGQECSERENVVQRTVAFVGKICLTDVLGSRKLNNTPFRVFLEKPREGSIEEIYFEKEGGRKKLFRTDGNSCISIPIELKHNLYNRQKYFQVDMHILSEELNLYGKVRLALSPWQRAFQAFQDAQHLNERFIRFETKGIPKPELIINQFRCPDPHFN